MDKNQFSSMNKKVISNCLDNDPTYISQHKIFHYNPKENLNFQVWTLRIYFLNVRNQLRSKRFEVFSKEERHETLKNISATIKGNYFLNFDQIVHLVADELITNACLAQSSPIPPVRIKYTETEDSIWLQIKDHSGSLTPR